MEDRERLPSIYTGLLILQSGGCLPPQVRDFLAAAEPNTSDGATESLEDAISFYVLPVSAVKAAVAQGRISCPALWVDQEDANNGCPSSLHLVYQLGAAPQLCSLPFKAIQLQPARKTASSLSAQVGSVSYRAYVPSKLHIQIYRLKLSLFPKLERLHQELIGSNVRIVDSAQNQSQQSTTSLDQIRALPIEQGLLLERHDPQTGRTAKLSICLNFAHACIELREPAPRQTSSANGGAVAGSPCLRSITSLDEALIALHGRTSGIMASSSSQSALANTNHTSNTATAAVNGPEGLDTISPLRQQSAARKQHYLAFQSPAKAPINLGSGLESVKQGIRLVRICSSAMLREGTALLQAAASNPVTAVAAIEEGAMEALVTAAASVLPSGVMGSTEQLTMFTLCASSLLDGATGQPQSQGASRTVMALMAALQRSAANPLLLCKLLVALLQRPDVRLEALEQNLAGVVSETYLRKSPLLEPLARALLASPRTGGSLSSRGTGISTIISPLGGTTTTSGLKELSSNGTGLLKHSSAAPVIIRAGLVGIGGSSGGNVSSSLPSDSDSHSQEDALEWPRQPLSVGRISIPRLSLPEDSSSVAPVQSPTGGFTRATRRSTVVTPGGSIHKLRQQQNISGQWTGGSPRSSMDHHSTAAAPSTELAALAEGIGESLMALDLPCLIAHKREADVDLEKRRGDVSNIGSDSGIPLEAYESTHPGSAQAVQAHRILVTARSLRSIDTSPERGTPAGSGASGPPGGSPSPMDGVRLADPSEVKLLLLQALLATLPIAGAGEYPARDPSPVLAAEVLSLPLTNLSPAQEGLQQICLDVLVRLSRNPATGQPNNNTPASVAASVSPASGSSRHQRRQRHCFIAAIGTKLTQLLSGGVKLQGAACEQGAQLLQLTGQYLEQTQSSLAVDTVVDCCLPAICAALRALHSADKHDVTPEDWSASAWELIHGVVAALGPALAHCNANGKSANALLGMLIGDGEVATVLAGIAACSLLQGEARSGSSSHRFTCSPATLPALQRDVLRLLSSLATLIGKIPPVVSGANVGNDVIIPSKDALIPASIIPSPAGIAGNFGLGRSGSSNNNNSSNSLPLGITRRQALSFFAFLIAPPANFVRRVLEHQEGASATTSSTPTPGRTTKATGGSVNGATSQPPSSHAVRLRQSVFDLLKAVLSAPGNPFLTNKGIADFYVRFHFIQFLKLYHNPHRDHQAPFLCRQHLAALLVLASAGDKEGAAHVRHRFLQLSVMDFFVRELSLEFEAKQPGRKRSMHPTAGDLSTATSITTTTAAAAAAAAAAMEMARAASAPFQLQHPQHHHRRTPSTSALLLPTPTATGVAATLSGGGAASGTGLEKLLGSPPITGSPAGDVLASTNEGMSPSQTINASSSSDVPPLRLPSRIPGAPPLSSSTSTTTLPKVPSLPKLRLSLPAAAAGGGGGGGVLGSRDRESSVSSGGSTPVSGGGGGGRKALSSRGGTPRQASRLGSRVYPEVSTTLKTVSSSGGSGVLNHQKPTIPRLGGLITNLPPPSYSTHGPLSISYSPVPSSVHTSTAIPPPVPLPATNTADVVVSGSDSDVVLPDGEERRNSGHGDASYFNEERESLPRSNGSSGLPSGFVFSGDLDADVELLEALENNASSNVSVDSDDLQALDNTHSLQQHSPFAVNGSPSPLQQQQQQQQKSSSSGPGLRPNNSSSTHYTTPSSSEDATNSSSPAGSDSSAVDNENDIDIDDEDTSSSASTTSGSSSSSMGGMNGTTDDGNNLDTRSSLHSVHAAASSSTRPTSSLFAAAGVPKLQLTSSMHSTLEARCAAAELQVALEAEQAQRQAGRSYFGDLEKSALGKGKMQAATASRGATKAPSEFGVALSGAAAGGGGMTLPDEMSYAEERYLRPLYRDEEMHIHVLVLVFTLILDRKGQLDPSYCDQYPWDRKLQNIPFILHHHLNHPDNRHLLPRLLPHLDELGPPALRLLRTLCAAFFRPYWYSARSRISGVAGAYATVYRCRLPDWCGGGSVVLKLLDTPKHVQDRCGQVDFHSEVTILETLGHNSRACKMYDYGLDPSSDAMYLVLKDYRCSLKQWRARQPADPSGQLQLYYAIFREVLVAARGLLEAGVVHFDIKCDNILLEPLPGTSVDEFWAPTSCHPPFKVVLADFGESKLFTDLSEGATTSRARGTDCFKSPEMLLVGGAVHKTHRAYDRRRRQGAGAASDVWSLGCLLYELVTGRLLFSDSDWLQLVARVTSVGMQLITDDKAHVVNPLPGVYEMLQCMLVRDAALRPSLRDVQDKLDSITRSHALQLPGHVRPPPGRGPFPQTDAEDLVWTSAATAAAEREESSTSNAPMPLCTILPLTRRLLLGPVSAVKASEIRKLGIQRVVLLAQGDFAERQLAAQQRADAPPLFGGEASFEGSLVLSSPGKQGYYNAPDATALLQGAMSARSAAAVSRSFAANPLFNPTPLSDYSSSSLPSKNTSPSKPTSRLSSRSRSSPAKVHPSEPVPVVLSTTTTTTGAVGSTSSLNGLASAFAQTSLGEDPLVMESPRLSSASSSSMSVRQMLRYTFSPASAARRSNAVLPLPLPGPLGGGDAIFDATAAVTAGATITSSGSGALFGLPSPSIARQLQFDLDVLHHHREKKKGGSVLFPPNCTNSKASNSTLPQQQKRHSLLSGEVIDDVDVGVEREEEDTASLCERRAVLNTLLSEEALCTAALECVDAEASCEMLCVSFSGGDATAEETLAWLESALPLFAQKQGPGSFPVLIATEEGSEGDAALLAVAALMAESGATMYGDEESTGDVCTTYLAAVHAARWGIDLHLNKRHVEALRLWNVKKKGRTL